MDGQEYLNYFFYLKDEDLRKELRYLIDEKRLPSVNIFNEDINRQSVNSKPYRIWLQYYDELVINDEGVFIYLEHHGKSPIFDFKSDYFKIYFREKQLEKL